MRTAEIVVGLIKSEMLSTIWPTVYYINMNTVKLYYVLRKITISF